jgi:hypothetical protein
MTVYTLLVYTSLVTGVDGYQMAGVDSGRNRTSPLPRAFVQIVPETV